jgi:hypothetical protein
MFSLYGTRARHPELVSVSGPHAASVTRNVFRHPEFISGPHAASITRNVSVILNLFQDLM